MHESRRPVAEQGWDSFTEIVGDEWIERSPRRPEVRAALQREARILARIADLLALEVPRPVVLEETATLPWRLRHRMVPGEPVDPLTLDADDGRRVGGFLRGLHDLPVEAYDDAGLRVADDRNQMIDRMRDDVLPLVPAPSRVEAAALLDRCRQLTPLAIAHGDLGPSHLLTTDGRVTGVIDWTDVALHDPALDLAWLLHGTPAAFVDALSTTYRPSDDEQRRAHDQHRLGPWWEVLHGLDEGETAYVDSGLLGILDRL